MKRAEKQNWKLPDVIDFEYFLHEYETEKRPAPSPSDREIYLTHIEPAVREMPLGVSNRKAVFFRWLDIKRQSMEGGNRPSILPPGQGFRHALTLMLIFLAVTGFFSGVSLSASLLFYSGNHPINVSIFIGIVILFQISLLLLLLIAGTFRQSIRVSPVHQTLVSLFLRLMKKTISSERIALSSEREGEIQAIAGLLNGKRRTYGSLFLWPFFVLTQTFGLSFNIGIFLTTWIRILGTDLAFGWQSTLQISAKAVYQIVSVLSIPWAWFVPEGIAHPTLSQIEGSRLILKEGIDRLATSDMVSWWPFLLFSVFFYGILPRLLLLFLGIKGEEKALEKIKFNTFACDKLLLGMTTPALGEAVLIREAERADLSSFTESRPLPEIKGDGGEGLIAIFPKELVPFIDQAAFDRKILDVTGRNAVSHIPAVFDFSLDQGVFPQNEAGLFPPVLILQEAWQPPIRETLSYFKEMRRFIGTEVPIIIFLVGKPVPGNILTPVPDTHYTIWKQVVNGLGDPYLHIERIAC